MNLQLPASEFAERIARVQKQVQQKGLDALLVHSHEADFANVRYLSDYWPLFETAGVLVPAEGEPTLLIGPESEAFAADRSKIKRIRKMIEYRESAEPDYPGVAVCSFPEVFAEALGNRPLRRLGIAGYALLALPVYDALRRTLPAVKLEKADDILFSLRSKKSPAEITLLQKAFTISEEALDEVLEVIRPGMSELEIVGVAQKAIYARGAEYEGHPLYVLSGPNSRHAISRPSARRIQAGELLQLNIGARVGGYSSSVGCPVAVGKVSAEARRLMEAGLEGHRQTMQWMRAGVPAKEVATRFYAFMEQLGVSDNLLYGPCHGLGMMEVERPWIETTSEYLLEENMTFQVDTFLQGDDFGLRWENGVRITASGVEPFSSRHMQIHEIGV